MEMFLESCQKVRVDSLPVVKQTVRQDQAVNNGRQWTVRLGLKKKQTPIYKLPISFSMKDA